MSELKKKALKGTYWSVLERFSTQLVTFLLGIFIARLLSPQEFGLIAMLSIFFAIFGAFVDSGFSSALIRKPTNTEVDNSTTFFFNVVVGGICFLIFFILAPFIASFFKMPILAPVVRVVSITVFINSLCVVQQALLTIRLDFKTQAQVSLVSAVVSGLIGLVMAYMGFGVWSLVAQMISASTIRCAMFWCLVKWRPQLALFSYSAYKSLFSYGSKILISGLIDVVYSNIYTFVIGKFFTASKLGYYSRADQFAQFPSSNISAILLRVTFPLLSSIQNDEQKLYENYRKILRMSCYVIFPLMIGLAAVSQPLILSFLTPKWVESVTYLQIICFAMMWNPVAVFNLNILQVKGRSDLYLRLEIIKKVISTIVLVVTIPMGIGAMCWGRVVTSVISLGINSYYSGEMINFGIIRQLKDILPIFLHAVLMGIIVYLSVSLIPLESSWLKLCIGLIVGGVFYIGTSALFRTEDFRNILILIKNK